MEKDGTSNLVIGVFERVRPVDSLRLVVAAAKGAKTPTSSVRSLDLGHADKAGQIYLLASFGQFAGEGFSRLSLALSS